MHCAERKIAMTFGNETTNHSEQIIQLLNSLVGALSAAIDELTPYNANHTRNMARYAQVFFNWLDKQNIPLYRGENQRRAFIMAVWLHDVGKLAVPLEIMNKKSRLGTAIENIRCRFNIIALTDRISELEGKLDKSEATQRQEQLKRGLEFIEKLNCAPLVSKADIEIINELAAHTYTDENGQSQQWLTNNEVTSLSITRGTLTADEREIMESHVRITERILAQVYFPDEYAQVPVWAKKHHEFLNGNGYPEHLTADNISIEARLLTIMDVFEALIARDRPYKSGIPVEQAISILRNMADEGSIDSYILELFIESKAWETI